MSLRDKLKKSRNAFSQRLGNVFKSGIHSDTLYEAEEILLTSDMGWELSEHVLERLNTESKGSSDSWRSILQEILIDLVPSHTPPVRNQPLDVLMVVGVNGAGKTTTIARLAELYSSQGETVLMACADTYRAAAANQLSLWGERLGVDVFAGQEGADPGAVTFDAVKKALAGQYTSLIIDTAGRLPTQKGLMDELAKVKRVAGKAMEGAPHRVLLVLDGTVGQNALPQARQFMDAVGVTDLAVTKLDGTAKGGAVFAMARELDLPIRYIGVGEGSGDLVPFEPKSFIKALVGEND